MMTTQFAKLPEGLTVRQALDEVAKQAEELETIYYIYIVDAEDHLRGLVGARHLLSALGKPNLLIDELMDHELVIGRSVTDDQEQVAQRVAQFDLHAIPVVDEDHHMLGIITPRRRDRRGPARGDRRRPHGRCRDARCRQLPGNRLLHRVASASEPSGSPACSWQSCSPSAPMEHFDYMVRRYLVCWAPLIPLCISTGGNSGLASGHAHHPGHGPGTSHVLSDWWRVLWHELAMGVALGFSLGLISIGRILLTPESWLTNAPRMELAMATSQAVAMICILQGTLVGSMLPLVFRRLGFDPGYASSPFVATFVDVTGIVIFFSVAELWLPMA